MSDSNMVYEAYLCRCAREAYVGQECQDIGKSSRRFEHKIARISCPTFRGKVMSQNGFRAKLCFREIAFDSSIQAHWTGDFMSQKWRIYGLSDSSSEELHPGYIRNLIFLEEYFFDCVVPNGALAHILEAVERPRHGGFTYPGSHDG